MKKRRLSVLLLQFLMAVCILFLSFKPIGGTAGGHVVPAEGGLRAFLFSAKDTLSVNVVSGAFRFSNVAAGNYNLLIEAAPPYRNTVKDGIRIVEGEFTDAGQIELQKQ